MGLGIRGGMALVTLALAVIASCTTGEDPLPPAGAGGVSAQQAGPGPSTSSGNGGASRSATSGVTVGSSATGTVSAGGSAAGGSSAFGGSAGAGGANAAGGSAGSAGSGGGSAGGSAGSAGGGGGPCVPETCAGQGLDCGTIADGCGAFPSCGLCNGANETCVNNVCQQESCTTICTNAGYQCGSYLACFCGVCGVGTSCVSGNCEVNPFCGDNICNGGETQNTCCQDCGCPGGSSCVNGSCKVNPFCGDNVCNGGETQNTCCQDCGCPGGSSCINGSCEVGVGVMSWTVHDVCLNGENISFKFYDEVTLGYWGQYAVMPGQPNTTNMLCTLGHNICFGGNQSAHKIYWGVNLDNSSPANVNFCFNCVNGSVQTSPSCP